MSSFEDRIETMTHSTPYIIFSIFAVAMSITIGVISGVWYYGLLFYIFIVIVGGVVSGASRHTSSRRRTNSRPERNVGRTIYSSRHLIDEDPEKKSYERELRRKIEDEFYRDLEDLR